MTRLRIGTRGSPLALVQAGAIQAALRARGVDAELVPIRTEGDRRAQVPLATIGGKGLFVREIEGALLDGRIDLAVHSLKDLPAGLPGGLVLAAFPPREDPRDVLVTQGPCRGLGSLAAGATVATGSLRRRALLHAARPDLRVEPIRGNVDTRLRRLAHGDFDAVVLAAAGLARLGTTPAHTSPLPTDEFVPAVGQGILAIEVRAGDEAVGGVVGVLDDEATRCCAMAERAYLRRLGASCNTPLGGHATIESATLRMIGVVLCEDGTQVLRDGVTGAPEDAEQIGEWLAESLLAQGARAMLGAPGAGVAPLPDATRRSRA
jgi:hydroxymethylbilane synthase